MQNNIENISLRTFNTPRQQCWNQKSRTFYVYTSPKNVLQLWRSDSTVYNTEFIQLQLNEQTYPTNTFASIWGKFKSLGFLRTCYSSYYLLANVKNNSTSDDYRRNKDCFVFRLDFVDDVNINTSAILERFSLSLLARFSCTRHILNSPISVNSQHSVR